MSHRVRQPRRDPPFETRVPVAPGVALHVERREGDAAEAPFVLVHGLASNLRLWDGVAEELQTRGHTVIALDQRGHGRSDAPESSYGIETAVVDLMAVIEALGLQRPVVAGQSWGGNVALELGWQHPRAVRGIACVDGGIIELADWFPSWDACIAALTPPRLEHLTPDDFMASLRADHPELPERAITAALESFRLREDGRIEPRLARHRHLEIVRSLWKHRPSARYATLETPMLLVLADTGDPVRTAAMRRAETLARAAVPHLRSHWVSPAHHDIHSQFPGRVAEFLAAAAREKFFA